MPADRYAHLDAYADCGLGSDELGMRRFTRLSERLRQSEPPAAGMGGPGADRELLLGAGGLVDDFNR